MKRVFSFMLALSMIMAISANASAFKGENNQPLEQKEAILVSVETISNEEADNQLPEEMQQALGNSDVSPLGVDVPSADVLWDLTEDGPRHFHASVTFLYPIYSSYCFTGHNGAIKLEVYEDTEVASGKTFDFVIYKRGLINTKVYTFVCFYYAGNTISRIDGFDADDLIYFKIEDNLRSDIHITNDSFIAKA